MVSNKATGLLEILFQMNDPDLKWNTIKPLVRALISDNSEISEISETHIEVTKSAEKTVSDDDLRSLLNKKNDLSLAKTETPAELVKKSEQDARDVENTRSSVAGLMRQLMAMGEEKKKGVKYILDEHHAKSVNDIPDDCLVLVQARLLELIGM